MEAVRYAFNCEWHDHQNGVLWQYTLRHYPQTSEIELLDSKGRLFLKRTVLTDISTAQLVLGAVVTVFGRQLRLVGYGDAFTAAAYQRRIEGTLALIKPDGMRHMGEVLTAISAAGFQISRLRLCQLSQSEAQQFYSVHRQQPFFPALTDYMSSGPILALELVGEGAVNAWRQALGPTDSNLARQQAPSSIRARFGTDKTRNCCHGSDSGASAVAELSFFFGDAQGAASSASVSRGGSAGASGWGSPGRVQPQLEGTTLCLIKPHAVREGKAGAVVSTLQHHGFQIRVAESFELDRQQATRFHEVYRGVVTPAEFEGMVAEMSSGTCIALEVALPEGAGISAVEPLRTLCGPADPELARAARPGSLRAQLGGGAPGKNAVHCTDLEEDAQLEVGFFWLQ